MALEVMLWSLNDQLKLTFIQNKKGPKEREVHSFWVKTSHHNARLGGSGGKTLNYFLKSFFGDL